MHVVHRRGRRTWRTRRWRGRCRRRLRSSRRRTRRGCCGRNGRLRRRRCRARRLRWWWSRGGLGGCGRRRWGRTSFRSGLLGRSCRWWICHRYRARTFRKKNVPSDHLWVLGREKLKKLAVDFAGERPGHPDVFKRYFINGSKDQMRIGLDWSNPGVQIIAQTHHLIPRLRFLVLEKRKF